MRFLIALLLSLSALPLQAATIGTFTRDYGLNGYNPGTDDQLEVDHVQIDDNPTGDTAGAFVDMFDLSSLAGAVIESITLTLTYAGVAGGERWYFDIYGSDPSTFLDNSWTALARTSGTTLGTASLTIDAASDVTPVDAFATTLANQALRFGFEEVTNGSDSFRLYSAMVTVNGTAAVPIPAPGALLLLGLGLLAWRRRRGQAKDLAAA